jgi:hypothetical protein
MWHENEVQFASIIKPTIGIIPDSNKTEEVRVNVTLY